MNYAEYYGTPFRRDLASILASHAQPHPESGEDIALQPRMLARDSDPISSWQQDRVELFATALYFTVLVDMVAYSCFHSHYAEFRKLTMYPKLLGDCLGACGQHLHPSDVFMLVAREANGLYFQSRLDCSVVFREAIPVMQNEVFSFFQDHLRLISPADFWALCTREFPDWAIVPGGSAAR